MLRKRIVTALFGIPLLIVVVWFAEPISWLSVVAAGWGMLAAYEYYRLVGVSRVIPLTLFGLVWTVLFVLQPHFSGEATIPLLLTSSVVLSLILTLFFSKKEGIFSNWAWMIGGIFYVGWLLSYLVALRLEPGIEAFPEIGRNLVFLTFFVTFGSDTMAYFIGKAIGRHKLAPRISPGKTWEGTIAGIIGAVIVSLLFTLSTPFELPLNYLHSILLGVLISIFGQIGDLVESLLKRHSGAKESGSLMPGHGGLLDRMDSVVFAGVVVYLYYTYVLL
jgi:phosphatidate cytidylyltransferase